MVNIGRSGLWALAAVLILMTSCASAPTGTKSSPASTTATTKPAASSGVVFGSHSAKVHIVVYTDLQCHACYLFHTQVEPTIMDRYVNTGKVTLDLRFVSILGPASSLAAEGVFCAGEQGKAAPFADAIQSAWNDKAADAYTQPALEASAAGAGLATAAFNSCLVSGKYRQTISNNTVEAGKLGIDNIPTIFVDGVKIVGAQPVDVFVNAIEAELAK